MPTMALTGVRMMLMALKTMLMKVKRSPMMRMACVAISMDCLTILEVGGAVVEGEEVVETMLPVPVVSSLR